MNNLWLGECGESCHAPLHPTLLPERSWKAVMAGLDRHFGDDASLESRRGEEILKFLNRKFCRTLNNRGIAKDTLDAWRGGTLDKNYQNALLDEEAFKD